MEKPNHALKIMLLSLPLREVPTVFPPMGILAIQNYLRKHGITKVEFYHLDVLRPAYSAVLEHIEKERPDVVGISAVVSTAYAYTKRLTLDIRQRLDSTLVVVGGNLAASAELLLRKTGTDLCVLGEGERIFLKVVERAKTTRNPSDFQDITGLALLDDQDNLVNTGYEHPLDKGDIFDIDWQDLERTGTIDYYIFPLFDNGEFRKDPRIHDGLAAFDRDQRTYQPHRREKNLTVLNSSKGCVARCTYCHRWEKGIRHVPPDLIVARIQQLIRDKDIGFISFGDEDFGTDRRWLEEFCEKIAPLDLLWSVGGMRVNLVDPRIIAMMRDAGCCNIYYGMETGSADMLQVMEKRVSMEANRNAMQWTIDAGLSSIVQIVLRMPGETQKTMRETTDFCKMYNTLSPQQDPTKLAIFYVQALPGTPLYEYARRVGLIGSTLDEEEKYLLDISNQEATDPRTSLNFSDYPVLTTLCWPFMIQTEVNYAYIKKFGLDHFFQQVFGERNGPTDLSSHDSGQRIIGPPSLWRRLLTRLSGKKPEGRFPITRSHPVFFYHLRHFGLFFVLAKTLRQHGVAHMWKIANEYLRFRWSPVKERRFEYPYKSLRKIVASDMGPLADDAPQMLPLRKGR